jgi:hypothetical protein
MDKCCYYVCKSNFNLLDEYIKFKDYDNCRYYVCKSNFNLPDECIKFKDYETYDKSNLKNLSLQKVCFKYTDYFDKLILMKRSKKLERINIILNK